MVAVTSAGVVAQLHTLIRMARIPSQVVPPKKAVPSAWRRSMT